VSALIPCLPECVYTLCKQTSMLNPIAKHNRRAAWAITGLEAGAVLFILGLVILYLNPFWHFDEGGFLDWRVHW
jgi:hypothetical protein